MRGIIIRLAAILGGLALIATATPAVAATGSPAARADIGVTLGPTRVELNVRPGHTTTQIFTVAAHDAALQVVSETVVLTQNAKGQMTIAHPKLPGVVTGTSWVRVLPAKYRLAPHQVHQFRVLITPPGHVQPGQRALAVLFTGVAVGNKARTTKGGKIGSGVDIAASVGGEMILNLPGKTTHDTLFGLHVPWISFGGSVPVTATVRNEGNTLALINKPYAYADGHRINLPSMLQLGGTARTLQTVFTPGGIGPQTVTWMGQSATVIVIPGMLLLILGGLIALIIGLTLYRRSLHRRAGNRRHGRGGKPALGGAR